MDWSDRWGALALLVAIAVYSTGGLIAARRATAPPAGRMRAAGWVVIAGALVAYFGLPHHLPQLGWMTFYPRFALTAATLLLLAVPAGLRAATSGAAGRRRAIAWLTPALAVGIGYGALLLSKYRAYGAEVADFAWVLDRTPTGGKAIGLVFDRLSRVMRIDSAFVALPAYYVVERRARGSFVPVHYCGMAHMPCRLRDPRHQPPSPNPWEPQRFDPARALGWFDYFLVRAGPPPAAVLGAFPGQLEVLAERGRWVAYRRRPGAPPPPPTGPGLVPKLPAPPGIQPALPAPPAGKPALPAAALPPFGKPSVPPSPLFPRPAVLQAAPRQLPPGR